MILAATGSTLHVGAWSYLPVQNKSVHMVEADIPAGCLTIVVDLSWCCLRQSVRVESCPAAQASGGKRLREVRLQDPSTQCGYHRMRFSERSGRGIMGREPPGGTS